MANITPNSRPKALRVEIEKYLGQGGVNLNKTPVCIVGVRGYYSKTFGKPGNDIGVDDDAFFLITPRTFKSFNGNVDPSVKRKGIATLVAGLFNFVKWWHKGKYRAFQITKDRVSRYGLVGVDTGRHGINFHKHVPGHTNSEGCQTIPESQYLDFIESVDKELSFYKQTEGVYLLVELNN